MLNPCCDLPTIEQLDIEPDAATAPRSFIDEARALLRSNGFALTNRYNTFETWRNGERFCDLNYGPDETWELCRKSRQEYVAPLSAIGLCVLWTVFGSESLCSLTGSET